MRRTEKVYNPGEPKKARAFFDRVGNIPHYMEFAASTLAAQNVAA